MRTFLTYSSVREHRFHEKWLYKCILPALILTGNLRETFLAKALKINLITITFNT